MSAFSVVSQQDWSGLEEITQGFRNQIAGLDQLVSDLFLELDRAREQLARQALELKAAHQLNHDQGEQIEGQQRSSAILADDLASYKRLLQAALSELRQQQNADQQKWQQHLAQHDRQLAESINQTLTSSLQTSLQSSLQGNWQESRDWQATLQNSLQEKLQESIATSLSEHLQALPIPQLSVPEVDTEALEELSAKNDHLETQRIELEYELEVVRNRALQLQEQVDRQRREIKQLQTLLTSEVRQLHDVIDQQNHLLGELQLHSQSAPVPPPLPGEQPPVTPLPAAASPKPPSVRATTPAQDIPAPAPAADPVVNSVMAQFAKLQKDVAQRKKRRT
ncbi:MAG: hypothetical protein ACO1RA_17545 [Planctomycetaceae bacterium]